MTDRDTRSLLDSAMDGSRNARGALMERLRPRLVLWVSARLSPDLRSKVEPEDVAQEVLLSVHKGLDAFQDAGDRAFFGWLFRVAENRIRDLADYFGAQKRQPVQQFSFSETTPSTVVSRSEELERVRRAIAALPDDYREVIRLRRLEELEVPEVAERMARSANAVRILYCRALRALREAMRED
ncbi:MAG: sigma-70 family RNA polymerase sigma factor [Planctomycetota bacterium]|jgi:RNA polymerase sigma-70 factor (ECF subfamily)